MIDIQKGKHKDKQFLHVDVCFVMFRRCSLEISLSTSITACFSFVAHEILLYSAMDRPRVRPSRQAKQDTRDRLAKHQEDHIEDLSEEDDHMEEPKGSRSVVKEKEKTENPEKPGKSGKKKRISAPHIDGNMQCSRSDGKQWRCKGERLPGSIYCLKHFKYYKEKNVRKSSDTGGLEISNKDDASVTPKVVKPKKNIVKSRKPKRVLAERNDNAENFQKLQISRGADSNAEEQGSSENEDFKVPSFRKVSVLWVQCAVLRYWCLLSTCRECSRVFFLSKFFPYTLSEVNIVSCTEVILALPCMMKVMV